MKILPAIALLGLPLLAACNGGTEEIVGRWASDRGKMILQIADAAGGRVEIDITSVSGPRFVTRDYTGNWDGSLLTYSNGFETVAMRYEADSDRLTARSVVFTQVPDGWMWGDGDPS